MKKFIEWDSLEFKRDSGKEALRCPECNDIRTDKKDKALKIKHDEGFGNCFYCEAYTIRDISEKNVRKDYTFQVKNGKTLQTFLINQFSGYVLRE